MWKIQSRHKSTTLKLSVCQSTCLPSPFLCFIILLCQLWSENPGCYCHHHGCWLLIGKGLLHINLTKCKLSLGAFELYRSTQMKNGTSFCLDTFAFVLHLFYSRFQALVALSVCSTTTSERSSAILGHAQREVCIVVLFLNWFISSA